MSSIHAVLTCFNRRRRTERCLARLFQQSLPGGVCVRAYVTDDGSTDGTYGMLRSLAPRVVVVRGNGQLYWCGGMRLAWRAAASGDPDYYLLLNDDTLLYPNALRVLLAALGSADARRIAVGAISDPESGELTYGGVRRGYCMFPPRGATEPCDTFNANAVLVPRAVYQELGIFHDAYTHAMGDFDYGFQARKRGIAALQTPCFIGMCARNSSVGTWRDRSLSRRARLRILTSPKGLPLREWIVYNRRNTGWRWPIRSFTPYLRVLLGL
jgi:GT2 family glycosyltransferase